MASKNTFRFAAFAAVASLGLGLFVSGCGDSGSTSPNPLTPATKTYKAIFNYNVLAASTAKATDIKAEIVTVKYAFYGKIDGQDFVEGPETDPSYTHNFTHGEQAAEELVTVNKVDSHATSVMAAYYDAEGNLVAVGQNDLTFDENRVATVAEPELDEVADDSITFTASKYVIPLQDTVVMSLKAIAANKEYDLSAFAEISGIDENILALQEGSLEGFTYKGVKYGTIEGGTITATVGNTKCLVGNSIYVTDQTPAAISLKPASVEGYDTFSQVDSEGQKYFMQYVDEKCYLAISPT